MEQKNETAEQELWCSGCQCMHPVSDFGVDRSSKRGYQCRCREAMRKRNVEYRKTEAFRASMARYFKSERGRASLARGAIKQRILLRERSFAIVGNACAWFALGGCDGCLELDHIIPVIRRHRTGYTSTAPQLYRWAVTHPSEAKRRLQPLCHRHNCFKGTMSDDEARAKWAARHPLTQEVYEEIIDKVA